MEDHAGEGEDEWFGTKADPWKEKVAFRGGERAALMEERETLQAPWE